MRKNPEIALGGGEFDVLGTLESNGGEIMSREQIVSRLAEIAIACDGASIGMRMSRLRRLMG